MDLEIASTGSIEANQDGYGVYLSNLNILGLKNADVRVKSSSMDGGVNGRGW